MALAAGIVLVAASFAAAAGERIGARTITALAAALGLLGVAAAALVAVGLVLDRWEWRELAITAAGFLLAALAEFGALVFRRSLERSRAVEQIERRGLARIDEALEAHAARRAAELEQTLARERAETAHLLERQERDLRDAHLAELQAKADQLRAELVQAVTADQQRVEQRQSAWSADLERVQQQLKRRLEELIREQADALRSHEQRLEEHARDVEALEESQHDQIARLRAELARMLDEAQEAAKGELETHAAERRRALHEVAERLRARERAMREQIEREQTELRAQLASSLAEVERRHLEQLQRLLDRAVVRLSEEAERQFDKQLREAREKTAERLSRELELAMEHFMKAAENEVVGRIAQAAEAATDRVQRQVDELVRTAEVQAEISNDRLRVLNEQLERSLQAARTRLQEFEAQVELEVSTRLGEIERALRSAGQTAS